MDNDRSNDLATMMQSTTPRCAASWKLYKSATATRLLPSTTILDSPFPKTRSPHTMAGRPRVSTEKKHNASIYVCATPSRIENMPVKDLCSPGCEENTKGMRQLLMTVQKTTLSPQYVLKPNLRHAMIFRSGTRCINSY